MNKLEHWENMREKTLQKKLNDQISKEAILQKKEKKLEKVMKNHDENIKECLERIAIKHQKWQTKIQQHLTSNKQEENQSYKKGAEHTKAIKEYLDKRKKDINDTVLSSPTLRQDSPISPKHQSSGKVWKVGLRSDRVQFGSTKQSFKKGEVKAIEGYQTTEEDDQVYYKMVKFEDKMKNAEERYFEKQQEIVQKGQQRASMIAQKREDYGEQLKVRWQDSFAKSVNRKLESKKKSEMREKMINTAVEDL